MVFFAVVLYSCVRAWNSDDMDGNCWQEFAGFLTARGGLARKKDVEQHDTGTFTMDLDIKDDDSEVLADQRALEGNWSRKCINRAVLVGTSIKPDSNASIKDRRPKYWTPKQGVSVNIASLPSYTLVHTDTNVKLCACTARDILGAEVQVFHTSCAAIYTKILEDAMQTAIHEAPLPMRLHRQYILIIFPPI